MVNNFYCGGPHLVHAYLVGRFCLRARDQTVEQSQLMTEDLYIRCTVGACKIGFKLQMSPLPVHLGIATKAVTK